MGGVRRLLDWRNAVVNIHVRQRLCTSSLLGLGNYSRPALVFPRERSLDDGSLVTARVIV
jgi:hypothetical protein